MKDLVGRTIAGISVGGRDELLSFDTDKGPVTYGTYGDCCSETWFADITGVKALIGGKVLEAEEVDMEKVGYNVDDGRTRQDSDSAYGWKLKTDKGYADIIFRNSSNGYYGGDIEGPTFEKPKEAMTPITDDWQAGAPSE